PYFSGLDGLSQLQKEAVIIRNKRKTIERFVNIFIPIFIGI
ncbi:unnamed protein product, partial [marine sediment metagenome]